MPSSTIATKMAIAPTSKRWFIACTMAKKPQNSTPVVKRLGRR
jgi:hypothetical protein